MAKNIHEKKKRIAHNKYAFSDENENMFSAGLGDFLSKIMDGMDNNLPSVYSNKYETNATKSSIKQPQQNNAINNISNSSTSRSLVSVPKCQKFGVTRKFPLMEKSQKALKQIRHNRKVPKPRAHLAGLSNLSLTIKSVGANRRIITKKSKKGKEINQNAKKTIKTPIKPVSTVIVPSKGKDPKPCTSKNPKPCTSKDLKLCTSKDSKPCTSKEPKPCASKQPKLVKSCISKQSKLCTSKRSKTEGQESCIKNEMYNINRHCIIEGSSSSVDNVDNNIAGNSSDSEYERFIKKSKKDLPRKTKLKTSMGKKKSRKATKKVQRTRKNTSKSLSWESDSELSDLVPPTSENDSKMSDVDHTSSARKVNKKRSPKNILKSLPSESDSETNVTASLHSHNKRSKVIKDRHKVENAPSNASVKNNAESEMDFYNDELYTRDSSSESDKADDAHNNNSLNSNNFSQCKGSDSIFPEVNSHNKHDESSMAVQHSDFTSTPKIISYDKHIASISSSVQHNIPTPEIGSYDQHIASLNSLSVQHEENNYISTNSCGKCKVSVSPSSIVTEVPVSCPDVKPFDVHSAISTDYCGQRNPSSNEPLIIDLSDSDNEYENTSMIPSTVQLSVAMLNTSQDKLLPHSDESDIEIVDVVLSEQLQKEISSPAEIVKSNYDNISQLDIKTEKGDPPLEKPENICKPNIELKTALKNKHEIAYVTNICKESEEETDSKANIPKQLHLNDTHLINVSNNLDDAFVLQRAVKQEPTDDECEIILDAVSSGSTWNLSGSQNQSNKKMKIEKDFGNLVTVTPFSNNTPSVAVENSSSVEKEQKLYEVACSNIKKQTKTCTEKFEISSPLEKQGMNDMCSADCKSLLKTLKDEFNTYQEILQTEASIGATFKVLERHQAEKLVKLRSVITKYLEISSGNNENSKIKKAMNTLFDSAELSSPESMTDSLKVPSTYSNASSSCIPSTSDICPDNLESCVAMNIVPLSSISECDIKPNLSELQCITKLESSSKSPKANTMSFGEKCTVCGKDAIAACQQCAKVFYCSDKCGKKYWEDSHKNLCRK